MMGLSSILGAVAPVVGNLIAPGIGGVIGTAVGGALSANDRNQEAEQAANRGNEFSAYMSNTAHRREMEDLEAAGLNPLLTGKYGGSSTPVGAMSVPQDVASGAINSALAASKQHEELELIRAQVEKTKQDVNTGKAEEKKILADEMNVMQDTTNKSSELYNIRARLPNLEIDNELKQIERGVKMAEKEQRFADVARLKQLEHLIRLQSETSALHLFYDTLQYPKRQTDYDIFSSRYGRAIQYANPAVDLFSHSASGLRDLSGAFRGMRRPELHFHNDRR